MTLLFAGKVIVLLQGNRAAQPAGHRCFNVSACRLFAGQYSVVPWSTLIGHILLFKSSRFSDVSSFLPFFDKQGGYRVLVKGKSAFITRRLSATSCLDITDSDSKEVGKPSKWNWLIASKPYWIMTIKALKETREVGIIRRNVGAERVRQITGRNGAWI